MDRKIKKIRLFVNDNEKSILVAKRIENELKNYGFEIVEEQEELLISIGGDGSFLRMVNENKFNDSVYYVGINAGTLGFLQEIDISECPNFIKRLSKMILKLKKSV